MTLGYNPSFADKPTCDGQHCDHGDDPDPSVLTYTAELTGAFVFNEDVTPNSKNTVLRSQVDVQLFRDPDPGSNQDLWNTVFAQCPRFFGPGSSNIPVAFMASADGKGWTIEKSGGVTVAFRNIGLFSTKIGVDVEVTLLLYGDTPYAADFLPEPGTFIEHPLVHFWINGKTVKGVTPRVSCDVDNDTEHSGDFVRGITLTITAPQ